MRGLDLSRVDEWIPVLNARGGLKDTIRNHLRYSVTIDVRSLAVFRVLLGLIIAVEVVLRLRNFSYFYTESGAVPRSLALSVAPQTRLSPEGVFSVYHLTTSSTLILTLMAVQVLVALFLTVGYRTRTATVLSFLFMVSLDAHNPLVLSYADMLLRLLLFWAIFLPLADRWAVDAVHGGGNRRQFTGIASALVLLQMVAMYLVNGVHKTNSYLWRTGEATPIVFGLDELTFLLGDTLREFPSLLYYGGMAWYYMLLLSWLLLLLRGRARTLFTWAFIFAHLSFAVTVRIGLFPYVSIAGLVLFLQRDFWNDPDRVLSAAGGFVPSLSRGLHRLETGGVRFAEALPQVRTVSEPITRHRETVYNVSTFLVVILLLTVVFVVVLAQVLITPAGYLADAEVEREQLVKDTVSNNPVTSPILNASRVFGVDQPDWRIFTPPDTQDKYYVFPAETQAGEEVDIYNDREMTFDRPYSELQKQHDTYRERFYMNILSQASRELIEVEALERYSEYLCSEWREEHGVEVVRFNMYRVEETVTLDTIDSPEDRSRSVTLMYAYGCGGHAPEIVRQPPADEFDGGVYVAPNDVVGTAD